MDNLVKEKLEEITKNLPVLCGLKITDFVIVAYAKNPNNISLQKIISPILEDAADKILHVLRH